MKKVVLLCVLPVCLGFMSACQPGPYMHFSTEARQLSIETEPAGAQVILLNLDGTQKPLGVTPLADVSVNVIISVDQMQNMPPEKIQDVMNRIGSIVVRIEKPGYQPYSGTLKTEHGKTVLHKIKLTALNSE